MKPVRPGSTMRKITAGPRLRCFLGFALAVGTLTAPTIAYGQSDCTQPHEIAVRNVHGQVYDAFGIPIPGATVLLLGIYGERQATADSTGRFAMNVPPGRYVMKIDAEGFQFSSFEVKVGRSLGTLLSPQNLHVILGFDGSYCPWVTTSKKEFQDTTTANLKRLKETSQKNATQK